MFAVTQVHAFLPQIVMKVGGKTFILITGLSGEERRCSAAGGESEKEDANRPGSHGFGPRASPGFALDFGLP